MLEHMTEHPAPTRSEVCTCTTPYTTAIVAWYYQMKPPLAVIQSRVAAAPRCFETINTCQVAHRLACYSSIFCAT